MVDYIQLKIQHRRNYHPRFRRSSRSSSSEDKISWSESKTVDEEEREPESSLEEATVSSEVLETSAEGARRRRSGRFCGYAIAIISSRVKGTCTIEAGLGGAGLNGIEKGRALEGTSEGLQYGTSALQVVSLTRSVG